MTYNTKYNYEQNRNDYLSPPELVQMALKDFNRDKFDLDTCCNQYNIPSFAYYPKQICNGLKLDWLGFNWCNPPFNECAKWIKKAYEEQQRGNTTVLLIPVRTETKYWHDYILNNKNVEIKWLRKKYKFLNPETKEPMGVFKNALALVYMKGAL